MSRRRGLAPLLLAAALAVGCGTETVDFPLDVVGGAVSGRVRTGGAPVQGRIYADDLDRDADFQRDLVEDGTYDLDLPVGRYRLSLRLDGPYSRYFHTAEGVVVDHALADTLIVTKGVRSTVDWELGTLRLDLGVPPESGLSRLQVRAHRLAVAGVDPESDEFASVSADIVDGRLSADLSGLRPGGYRLEFRTLDDYAQEETFWWPGTSSQAESPVFTLRPDSITTLAAPLELSPITVRGSMTGAWLDLGLLNWSTVYFLSPDSTRIMQNEELLHDGSFEMTMLVPRPFKIRAGYGSWFWLLGGGTFAESPLFTPEAGTDLTLPDIVLGALRLDIDPERLSSSELGYTRFSIHRAADGVLLKEFNVTPRDQTALLPMIPPGDFLLHMEPGDWMWGRSTWVPMWYDGAATMAEATPVTVPQDGGLVRIATTLVPGGSLTGDLFWPDEEGSYLGYITLYRDADGEKLGERFVSDDDDAFALNGIPDGRFRLALLWRASGVSSPWDTLWHPDADRWEDAETLTITDAAPIENLLFDLR